MHRAVEIWPVFITFVKLLMKLPKAKQLVRGEKKSSAVLKKAVDDPFVQAKMKFFELLSRKLNEFLREGIIQKKSAKKSKSNRGSCEAKMAKLLLKRVSQERIIVKEGDEAKKQSSKVVNDLATFEEETFLRSNKFTDGLDTFYAKLCIAEYSALGKVFAIIFCMCNGQSSAERGFNTNADMVADNQSDHALMALRMVHNHM